MRNLKTVLALLFFLSCFSFGQKTILEKTLSGKYSKEEAVTLSETLPFDKAIEILSAVSEQHTGKKIVLAVEKTDPIGIPIVNTYYKKALTLIVQYNSLVFEERENVIVVLKRNDPAANADPTSYASVGSREVKISAVFFEANITEMKERGINWEFLLTGKGVNIGGKILTFGEAQEQESSQNNNQTSETNDFKLTSSTTFKSGNYTGKATAAFKFFENENLGDIIAMPTVTVRDQTKGRIQIGSNISVKQRDFSGNVIETFIPTGTIIEITPFLYNEDDVDYILLKAHAERSTAIVGAATTEIKKTEADTEVLLLNGEETIIGGLFDVQQTSERTGIPILRDLPWWFFGIRYLTGYEQEKTIKKEVVILLKAEIVPTLKERVLMKKSESPIDDKYQKDLKSIKRYKINKFFSKEKEEEK